MLVNASAIGYYGPRGDEELTEDSPSGNDFLAAVCREWEAAGGTKEEFMRIVKPIDPAVINGLLGSLRESRPPMLPPENVVHFPARRAVE